MGISAIVAAVAATVAAIGGTTAAIIATTIEIGATVAEQLLTKRQKRPFAILEDQPTQVREELQPRRLIYGRTRVGAIWGYASVSNGETWNHPSRNDDTQNNVFLNIIAIIGEGPIEHIDELWLNNTKIPLFYSSQFGTWLATTDTAFGGDGGKWLSATFHTGAEQNSPLMDVTYDISTSVFTYNPNAKDAEKVKDYDMIVFDKGNGMFPETSSEAFSDDIKVLSDNRPYIARLTGDSGNQFKLVDRIDTLAFSNGNLTNTSDPDVGSPPREVELTGNFNQPLKFSINRKCDKTAAATIPNWTPDRQFEGLAYVYLKLVSISSRTRDSTDNSNVSSQLWNNSVPNISFVVRGRNDIVHPDKTMKYTSNAALCAAHYISQPIFGLKADFMNDIDQEELKLAATKCDERVPLRQTGKITTLGQSQYPNITVVEDFYVYLPNHGLNSGMEINLTLKSGSWPMATPRGDGSNQTAIPLDDKTRYMVEHFNDDIFFIYGGNPRDGFINTPGTIFPLEFKTAWTGEIDFVVSEYRYESNGVVSMGDIPQTILTNFKESLGGSIVYAQGQYKILAGEYICPTFTIDSSMIIDAVSYASHLSIKDKCNRVKGTFIGPANRYQATDFPAIEDANFIKADSDTVLTKDVELPLVASPYQCERIAKIDLLKNRKFQRQLKLKCDIRCLPLVAGQSVTVDLPFLNLNNVDFTITENSIGIEGKIWVVNLSLSETNPEIFAWDANKDQIDFTLDGWVTPQGGLR